MASTSGTIAKGRIVACALVLTLIGISVYCGIAAWKWKSDFYEWVESRPMQTTVDLTTPSKHSTVFKQTCAMAHGQSIYVAYDSPDVNDDNIAEHFAGLKGAVTIRDQTGAEVLSKPFDASTVQLWGDDPMLVGFYPFANGDYTAEIEIQQGASQIGGTQHEIYARNELCGLELMPAYVLEAISAIASLIACVVAYYTVPLIARHGLRVQLLEDKQ